MHPMLSVKPTERDQTRHKSNLLQRETGQLTGESPNSDDLVSCQKRSFEPNANDWPHCQEEMKCPRIVEGRKLEYQATKVAVSS